MACSHGFDPPLAHPCHMQWVSAIQLVWLPSLVCPSCPVWFVPAWVRVGQAPSTTPAIAARKLASGAAMEPGQKLKLEILVRF